MSAERAAASDALRRELDALPGVSSVDLSDYPKRVVVKCDLEGARKLAMESVKRALENNGDGKAEVRVEIETSIPRTKRARFDTIEVTQPNAGSLHARATLEWQRKRFHGEADEEISPAGEIRACAMATVRAVEQIAGGQVTFHLIGVKEVHVFDHDLVAVLLHSPELPGYRMIGTSIITDDRRRSAALAALSATNRAVGNFIDG